MPQEPIFLRTPASTFQSDSSVPCAVIRRELYVPRQTYRCHTAHIPRQTILFVTMYGIEAVVQRIVCTPSLEMTIVKVQCGGERQPSEQQVAGYNLHPSVYHVAHGSHWNTHKENKIYFEIPCISCGTPKPSPVLYSL